MQTLSTPANVTRYAAVLLFAILTGAYSYFLPRWADPNQNSRLDMVMAVVEDHTFQIDKYVANTVDYAKVGDHYYSDKAPGAAFLAMPIYAAFQPLLDSALVGRMTDKLEASEAFAGTLRPEGSGVAAQKVRFALAQVVLALAVSAVPTALLGAVMFVLLGTVIHSVGVRFVVVLGYGLLTPAFAYANAFYGHQLSAALLFCAFALVCCRRVDSLTAGRLLLVGLLLAYSVVTEYPTILMAGIIFLYVCVVLYRQNSWRRIGWVVAAGGVVAVGWMSYNTLIFGGPLTLGYGYSELWVDKHDTGYMSLTLVRWDALWGITFSRFRGLFFYAPWLLLSLPGAIWWWRSGRYRSEWVTAVACIASMFLFNASSAMWWGGYAVGPRYLLSALPFMVLCAAYAFARWRGMAWFRLLSAVLFLWSWIAVWGLTLAEQAFPPDYLFNPLVEYAWPNWQMGNIARNLGTLLGLPGIRSLMPLAGLTVLAAFGAYTVSRVGDAYGSSEFRHGGLTRMDPARGDTKEARDGIAYL